MWPPLGECLIALFPQFEAFYRFTAHTQEHIHTNRQCIHTLQRFALLVSGDSCRFVIVPCVSEASKLRSPGLAVLFPAVSLSEDQSRVKYEGILLNCWARHGTGSVYQLSANTHTHTETLCMQMHT